jgi:hypothetical protein
MGRLLSEGGPRSGRCLSRRSRRRRAPRWRSPCGRASPASERGGVSRENHLSPSFVRDAPPGAALDQLARTASPTGRPPPTVARSHLSGVRAPCGSEEYTRAAVVVSPARKRGREIAPSLSPRPRSYVHALNAKPHTRTIGYRRQNQDTRQQSSVPDSYREGPDSYRGGRMHRRKEAMQGTKVAPRVLRRRVTSA